METSFSCVKVLVYIFIVMFLNSRSCESDIGTCSWTRTPPVFLCGPLPIVFCTETSWLLV